MECWTFLRLVSNIEGWQLDYNVSGQFDISPSFSDGTWTYIKKVTTKMNSQHSNTQRKDITWHPRSLISQSSNLAEIQFGGGRHLEFREMPKVAQQATKQIVQYWPYRTHFHKSFIATNISGATELIVDSSALSFFCIFFRLHFLGVGWGISF